MDWLPNLAFRATFGYNGNLNYTYFPNPFISSRSNDYLTGYEMAQLDGIMNKQLRPEKTGQLNLGLSFGSKNGRITGGIEIYNKWNSDLINNSNIDLTTGYKETAFNIANMRGKGLSLSLNSVNIDRKGFNWSSGFLYSANKVTITNINPIPGLYTQ